ncbi:hypothetical protein [Streptomyces nymphaeiformis]|uniref:Uncharacterized protein n=1 Tax=Streptomyces nymphaeiformis TaxID=2663842 RepID=A0A7W7XA60_9ACTN|nr:hypothetical protein [Streptomyces nymphaeiformis]MBB4979788.1 hypothetical protein [Streptomyces nymphaeiformis]
MRTMEGSDVRLGTPRVLIVLDWRDGPLEGVLAADRETCWYFRLFAERFEDSGPDDRLYGLWSIPDADASVLLGEFGSPDGGAVVWPVVGGLGSHEAQSIVDAILSAERALPQLIVRTPDFPEVLGVWDVTSN